MQRRTSVAMLDYCIECPNVTQKAEIAKIICVTCVSVLTADLTLLIWSSRYRKEHCSSPCANRYANLHHLQSPSRCTNTRKHLLCIDPLQLLVLQLSFELLRFCHLSHRLVEIVLVDEISVVLDSKQSTI
jgi:hypothetical protein